MTDFPCTSCGGCCRRLHLADQKLLKRFGLTHTDGVCHNLSEEGKCLIYSTRPIICNIKALAEAMGENVMDYYKRNAEICNTWMEEDGFDGIIDLEQFDE